MATRGKQNKGRKQAPGQDWENWQKYVQKEKQRLLHKSGKRIVELSLDKTKVEQPEPVVDDLDETTHDGESLYTGGRMPPGPGVSREEAIQVSDDKIGSTVRPFTVNDYRDIKPLGSPDLFVGRSGEVIDDVRAQVVPDAASMAVEDTVETAEISPEFKPVEEEEVVAAEPAAEKVQPATKKKGTKKPTGKKRKQGLQIEEPSKTDLTLFTADIAEHQQLSRQRLTKKTKLEREELIEKLLDPVISLEEAATLIGVCKTTVRRYTNRGELDCLRTPGQQRRFKLSQVLEYVRSREDEERSRRERRRRAR